MRRLDVAKGLLVALTLVGLFAWDMAARRRQALRSGPTVLHTTGSNRADRFADASAYRLHIEGLVGRPLTLTLDQITSMPATETDAPLSCVVGWTDHAVWRGVPIRDVLATADPDPRAGYVVFRDNIDFSATLSMDYIETGKPLLAWQVNGEPLPREHGWPLRVVAPGKWGYKWVKWVTQVELTDRGYEGTYEESGFSLDGDLDEPKLQAEKEQ
jgi:DMSO/TMAO reductase YedYZ molybdopterin-dependent catalytic subunit